MSIIGDMVRSAREAKGWTQEDLAIAAGVSQTTIDKIERGVTKRSRFLHYIAARLDLNPADLDPEMYGVVTPRISKDTPEISERIRNSDNSLLPVYSSEQVNNDDGTEGFFIELSTTPLDYIPKPNFLEDSYEAYGVYVSDKNMSPEVEPGDILIFDPRLPFVIDTTCIFISHGSDIRILGRLVAHDKTSWTINQWGSQISVKFNRTDFPRLNRAVAKFYRR